MERFLRDVRHALRVFRKAGIGFVLTAVFTLAVGIGANTAIFSLVNTVLLKEPPFPHADRIVIFQTKTSRGAFGGASPAKFAHWARQTEVVEDVAAFGGGVVNWTGSELPRQLRSARVYRRQFPGALDRGESFTAATLKDSMVQGARQSIWVLAAAVGFVLLIACANVANLLLARAEARKRELAIRAALGVGRLVIIRQLLTECLLLASAGAVLGLLLGTVVIHALLSVNTANLPRVGINGGLVSLDSRVLLFTVVITLITTLIFKLFPAWHAARTNLSAAINEGANRSGRGLRQNKARGILVVTEVGLAVVLLVGAGLLIRTAVALYAVNPGFSTTNILTMRMSLSGSPAARTSAGIEQMIRNATQRLDALPGVELASATCCIPLEGGYGLPFRIMGRPLRLVLPHASGSTCL